MKWIYGGLVICLLLWPAKNAAAQDSAAAVAQTAVIQGETQDGMIICAKDNLNRPCDTAYDPNMIGVVASHPAVLFESETPTPGMTPLIRNGKAEVMVSAAGGKIAVGDYVTSSTEPGIAVKARKSGYALGAALTPFEAEGTGKIWVAVEVRPVVLSYGAGTNLLEMIRQGAESAFLTPLSALRYLVAGITVILSVTMGLAHFGKLAKSGVEAVGRNPLASNAIQLSVLFNVVLTAAIVGLGVGIAYLVITL